MHARLDTGGPQASVIIARKVESDGTDEGWEGCFIVGAAGDGGVDCGVVATS